MARGNPGLAGAGTVIRDPNGKTIEQRSHYLGLATPIQAEYQALVKGLEMIERRELEPVKVLFDNDQLWRQLTGRSRGHAPEVLELYAHAQSLLAGSSNMVLQPVDRDALSIADALANIAIDTRGRRQAID